MTHFDLAIIGTGSGNSLVTPDFDGKRVAIIESGTFGGTCVNVGCIPTKMYVYAADVANTVTLSAKYGIDATLDGVRWADIRDRVFGRIDPISEGGKTYRVNGDNTTLFLGRATFTGRRSLRIDSGIDTGKEITADQIVIAAGAHDSACRGQQVRSAVPHLRHRDEAGRAPSAACHPRIRFHCSGVRTCILCVRQPGHRRRAQERVAAPARRRDLAALYRCCPRAVGRPPEHHPDRGQRRRE